jgi:hypothetical protein
MYLFANPFADARNSSQISPGFMQMEESFPHFPQFSYFFFQLIP